MTATPIVEPRRPPRPVARAPGASSWFIALCMVVIAASLAAVLYLRLDVPLSEAGWIGFGALMVMVLAEFFAARWRERAAVEAELAEINRLAVTLQQDMAALKGQIGAVESGLSGRIDDLVDGRLGMLAGDLEALEGRVGELAETVAAQGRTARATPHSILAGDANGAADAEAANGPLAGLSAADALEAVRSALAENRVDVLLQPLVVLPQRRVTHYEALTRLRGEDGTVILPADYMRIAEPAGIMPQIDAIAVGRGMQILRGLAQRNRRPAIFCNISARALVDSLFFKRVSEFAEADRELAGGLVFELPQATFEALGPLEQSGLDSLAELGFRISVDHVTRLDIDGAAYAGRRVRFVKVDAGLLLAPPADAGARIHVADLARLLARSGIEVIAARIESEAELVDLLDYDIGLGQGHLFSPPRPVRTDALGGVA